MRAEKAKMGTEEQKKADQTDTGEDDDQPVWSGIIHNRENEAPLDRVLRLIPGTVIN